MPSEKKPAFFIGWSNSIDAGLGRFLAGVALALLAILAIAGLGLGRALDDPSATLLGLGPRAPDGGLVRAVDWQGGAALTGMIVNAGHPVLHVAADAAFPNGRTLILSGDGKVGPVLPASAGPLTLKGGLLQRGDIEMLVVEEPAQQAPGAAAEPPVAVKLGRWRAVGEICDGKCALGGMQPGAGLSHRACANLCLTGGVPPVFVTLAPIVGRHFLMLAATDGGPTPPHLLRSLSAIPVELTGDVERIGNLLVFRVNLAQARRL
jgi:hypothetical protein